MKTKSSRNLILMVLMLISTVFISVMVGQAFADREDSERSEEFMRHKLTYSQKVLEGLILENYGLIITNGIKMFNMSQSPHWREHSTSEYKKLSADYSHRVGAMVDAAREKRISAARGAYAKSLQSCFDCHNYCQRVSPSSPPRSKAGK